MQIMRKDMHTKKLFRFKKNSKPNPYKQFDSKITELTKLAFFVL